MKTSTIAAASAVLASLSLALSMAVANEHTAPEIDDALFAELIAEGEELFSFSCGVCHGDEGEGMVGPPLRQNTSNARGLARVIVNGRSGGMPPVGADMSHREIAAIMTYVRNSWGNEYGAVHEDEIEVFLAPIDI